MSKETKLDSVRAEIDAMDGEILALLNRRADLAQEIAKLKQQADGDKAVYYRPEREAQVLREIIGKNPGPLKDEEVGRLFREIMSACLALEQQLQVAYLGPQGTYTELAMIKHFGSSAVGLASSNIAEVFRDVKAGTCEYGVVPVENSIEGAVNQTLDLLVTSSLSICGEVYLDIHHCLMSQGGELENLKSVYAHQQSLAQCRSWLENHLPGVETVAFSSNAEAVKKAVNEERVAAIAGPEAAKLYGLPILATNIEDEPDNTTRFLVLGQDKVAGSGRDKTSILFANANAPGALKHSLACFADNGINMNKIESRPSRHANWEYVFFADLDGHTDDVAMEKALSQLAQHTQMLKVLGSYPRAVL